MSDESLDRIADGLTHAAWHVLNRSREELYPGYWVEIHDVIQQDLEHPGVAPVDPETRAARLAADVVEQLAWPLRRRPALILVAVDLPRVLHHVLIHATPPSPGH